MKRTPQGRIVKKNHPVEGLAEPKGHCLRESYRFALPVSELWNVSVLNRGDTWIDLEVVLAHPDAGAFPADPAFALLLLTAEAYDFDQNHDRVPNGPLGERIDFESSYLPGDVSGRTDEFIAAVDVYETRGFPWDEETAHEKIDSLCEQDGLSPDDKAWKDRWQDHWRAFWQSPGNAPRAKYRITVTDSRWLKHLEVGQRFDTAAFSEDGPWIDENLDRKPDLPADARGRAGVPGFAGSTVRPREKKMNADMIREMATTGAALDENEARRLLQAHARFLESGGREGDWQRFEVSGLPMSLYQTSAEVEDQLRLCRRQLARDFSGFAGAELSHSDLSGGVFEAVDFSGARIDNAMATDSFFAGSSFENASLQGTDFSGSDLKNVCFRGADLRSADFEIADCRGADFTGANLAGARFPGTNLKDIKH